MPRVPLSLETLHARSHLNIDRNRTFHFFLNWSHNLSKQADSYLKDGDFSSAYVYYLQFTSLVLDELPKFPEYRDPSFKRVLDDLKKTCRVSLTRLEKLKPVLARNYEDYVTSLTMIDSDSNEPKQKVQKQNNQTAIIETLPPYDPNWSVAQALPNISNQSSFHKPASTNATWTKVSSGQIEPFKPYPSILDVVSKKRDTQQDSLLLRRPAPTLPPEQPPALPSKSELTLEFNSDEISSPVDSDFSLVESYTEGGSPLRSMLLPEGLISQFLRVAHKNTLRNLETCGILCGCIEKGVFCLTHLLIPPQTATSDTCTTNNEEDLVLYQSTHDLLTLGWIHTHPTQSCFLSSVDLHTQLGYQLMLPEAVAVVCAPSENIFGTFRLTDPPGLPYIAQCSHPAAFHPHALSANELYMEATNGHVRFVKNATFKVVDLRQ